MRKAVIPAAGFGTRLFPATKAVKKEFFPIVDRDGIAKPALLLIVEEALQAGIEEVIVIVQPEDLDRFPLVLQAPRSPLRIMTSCRLTCRPTPSASWRSAATCRSSPSQSQEGFGHAVYLAREAVGDEPFLLMLGDHLYRSDNEKSCARQLLEAYNRSGVSVVGLRRTPEAEIGKFGTVTGQWIEEGRLLNVSEFAEKPTPGLCPRPPARGRPAGGGIPDPFWPVHRQPQAVRLSGRADQPATCASAASFSSPRRSSGCARRDGFLGLMIDGRCFDIGVPEGYLNTLASFREK